MQGQRKRRINGESNRREIFQRVVTEWRAERGTHNETRGCAKQQRVTIGRCFCAERMTERRPRAAAIVEHDLLSPGFSHLRCELAAGEINRAARRIRHDQTYWLVWIVRG